MVAWTYGRLDAVARQLRLDHLALTASGVLVDAGIPHALIKGVTTSQWLYDPPRDYRDVDLLVPRSRLDDAVSALVGSGLVHPEHGRLGEEGNHSLVLVATMGAELDLHVTLPSLTAAAGSDRLWTAMSAHVEPFLIDGRAVPALDLPGRCLVLALHAVASGQDSEQVREDLRRARSAAAPEHWDRALALAEELGVAGHVAGALALVEGGSLQGDSPEVTLRLTGGSASAIQLQRLATTPLHQLPKLLWAETFPSRAFMQRLFPDAGSGPLPLAVAYARRLGAILTSLPAALREVWAARRPGAR